jgi:hypothetical protein
MTDQPASPQDAASVWFDVAAFVVGLGMAWVFDWQTTDLVWSLWLSSLVVGYAMIVWTISAPLREVVGGMAVSSVGASIGGRGAVLALVGGGSFFVLAFFTVHFGGFHYVHSTFLNQFFPISPKYSGSFPHLALYGEVFRRYWWFLPAAAIAEREGFRTRSTASDTAVTPEAINARLKRGDTLMQPYKNVIRLHLLIFFFVAAHFMRLGNFWVYAVAYAVYFFPWRVLKRT